MFQPYEEVGTRNISHSNYSRAPLTASSNGNIPANAQPSKIRTLYVGKQGVGGYTADGKTLENKVTGRAKTRPESFCFCSFNFQLSSYLFVFISIFLCFYISLLLFLIFPSHFPPSSSRWLLIQRVSLIFFSFHFLSLDSCQTYAAQGMDINAKLVLLCGPPGGCERIDTASSIACLEVTCLKRSNLYKYFHNLLAPLTWLALFIFILFFLLSKPIYALRIGCGKTTLAHVLARMCGYNVIEINARLF